MESGRATVRECEPQVVGACPFCGGERLVAAYAGVRDQLGMSEGAWDWVRCLRCGSLLLSPRPPGEALAAFYPDEYAAAPAETSATGAAARLVHALEDLLFALQSSGQARIVRRLTGAAAGARMLDVGCGSGRQLERFRRMGFAVRGVDLRPEAVEEVRRRGIEAEVCAAESVAAVVPPGSLDLVTAFASLEHADDVRLMLAALHQVLRPGGWVALEVPVTPSCDERAFGTRWRSLTEAPRHTSIPSPSGMAALLRDGGFEDVRVAPDPVIMLGAASVLSMVPGADATLVWQGAGVRGGVRRLAAGLAVLPATVRAAWSVWGARRPSLVIVVARKAAG